jgi:NTE family protein
MFRFIKLNLLLVLSTSLISFQTNIAVAADPQQKTPKIGLVLAGGGALGFAHVGVLKVLERERIPVHFVTGTSMGAIVGAAYASGVNLGEMEKLLSETNWDSLFNESARRQDIQLRYKAGRGREIYGDVKFGLDNGKLALPGGLVQGQNVLPLLQRLYELTPSPVSFDALPIPFRAVTADIETGTPVIPDKGDLATIVRASMSVPAFFAPVDYEGKLLVDGGIANNLPVDEALKRGCDILIVVELYADYKKRDQLESPLAVTGQIISLLLAQNSAAQRALLRSNDILIEPDLAGFSSTDFAKGSEIMEKGKAAAEALVKKLKRLSINESTYRKFQDKRLPLLNKNSATITYVKLDNSSHLPDDMVLSNFRIKEGDTFDRTRIERGIKRLYNSGRFSSVSYSVEETDSGKGITLKTQHKKWMNEYFRFGASVEDDFSGDDSIRVGIAYRKTDINEWGSYWEVNGEIGRSPLIYSEFYQPLSVNSDYFVAPSIYYGRQNIILRDGERKIATYHRRTGNIGLGIGKELGVSSEARVSFVRGFGDVERDIGDGDLPEFSYDTADIYLTIERDSLNAPDFPNSGVNAGLTFVSSTEALGASDNYEQLKGRVLLPYTFDRNTVMFYGDFGASFTELPEERAFALGGFLDISGYAPSSLIASDYAIARTLYYRRFSEVDNPFFALAFFAGGSLEYSILNNDISGIDDTELFSGSVFLGADTPLMPLYLGFGMAEGNEASIYLSLGRISSRR